MKRRVKILIIGFALVSIVLFVAIFSQYAFIVAVVGDPFASSKEAGPHNSLVIVRKVDSAQNLTGKIVVFWWTAEYVGKNGSVQRRVLGIDRVANDDPTILGMAAETDEELRPRENAGYAIFRANVTGEFATIFKLPFQG